MDSVPVVPLENFLKNPESEESKKDIASVVDALFRFSCLCVRDPRVTFDDNAKFIDTMEKYYGLPLEKKMPDVHPELHYQVGATPELTEHPRDHSEFESKLEPGEKPLKPSGPDPKWRYFWRAGERPNSTSHADLNADQVIPAALDRDEWTSVMNRWSSLMLQSVETVSEMLAIGLGLERDAFTKRMKNAPHLLAPTGSDLSKWGKEGTVLAGVHTDLNFLTIHGKSRFPGLNIWLRTNKRAPVSVPDGCLLLQAGMQLEYLTGGHLSAGFHEVIVNERTVAAIEKAKAEGRSLWRVSSTLFSHMASDQTLEPLKPEWRDDAKFPPIATGEFVKKELSVIKLAKQ